MTKQVDTYTEVHAHLSAVCTCSVHAKVSRELCPVIEVRSEYCLDNHGSNCLVLYCTYAYANNSS